MKHRLFASAALASVVGAAHAQCASQWRPGTGIPGVTSIYPGEATVRAAVAWDPDGNGPLAGGLALAGQFYLAGDQLAANVVFRDDAGNWSPIGTGLPGIVKCLAVLPSGDLVAGGQYLLGNFAGPNVVRWNGTAWQSLGGGPDGPVDALLVTPSGDLVAGGSFTNAGTTVARGIARWDGASWHAFGSGSLLTIDAMTMLPNGDIVAGGTFPSLAWPNYVARWNGSAWLPLGSGTTGFVECLTTLANGDVVAGGTFSSAGGTSAPRIARWNGTSWQGIGGGMNATVYSVAQLPNGDLVAAGGFTSAGGTPCAHLARHDGIAWQPMGTGLQSDATGAEGHMVRVTAAGVLLVGGRFLSAGGSPALSIATWNGTAFGALATGTDRRVRALLHVGSGDLFAGGDFGVFRGVPARSIVRRLGGAWQPIGSGISGANAVVQALAKLANGDVVTGGSFTHADGVAAANIARWNGSAFVPLGSGVAGGLGGGGINAIAITTSQHVIAAGNFTTAGGAPANNIARWDGTSWIPLGAGVNDSVYGVGVLPNGDVVACGHFTMAGGAPADRIARWDGTTWHPLGTGLSSIPWVMHTTPQGDVYVGGAFTFAGGMPAQRVARWDGSSWSALGAGLNNDVFALDTLPNGDLIAGGVFVGSGTVSASCLARWNGTTWSAFGGGVVSGASTFAATNDGLAVGGGFTRANGAVSAFFAEFTTNCPPTVAALGAGCASTGAVNTLSPPVPVWAGGVMTSTATNLPPIALVGVVYGLSSTSLPLAAALPAGANCTLWVTPDLVDFRVATGGTCTAQLSVPYAVALAGVPLHHQMVPFGFDPSGALVDVGATQAFTLTIGAL